MDAAPLFTLPALRSGSACWRLPLADRTALALLDIWLTESPASPATLLPLAADPALMLWAACQPSSPLATGPCPPAELAGWLAETTCRLIAADADPQCWLDLEAPAWIEHQTRLDQARARAVDESQPPGAAFLVALLISAGHWLRRFQASGSATDRPPLPGWFTLEQTDTPSANGRPAADTNTDRAAPDSGRLVAAPASLAPAGLLTRLAGRLAPLVLGKQDQALALQQEKLASLAEFAAGAGHEMNNPLAVISGRAQLALRTVADPALRRDLATMHTQALRVHEMIADLMLFARPPAPRPRRTDLVEVAVGISQELSEEAARRGITLLGPAGQPPAWAWVDPAQIAVAVRAMAENSLRAAPPGGEIEIRVGRQHALPTAGHELPEGSWLTPVSSEHPTWALIEVADNGPGLSPEARRHLFDPYYSGYPAGRGLGLGLSKSWQIARQNGGELAVESRAEGGVCLRMRLPADRRNVSAELLPAPATEPAEVGENAD